MYANKNINDNKLFAENIVKATENSKFKNWINIKIPSAPKKFLNKNLKVSLKTRNGLIKLFAFSFEIRDGT